MPKLAPVIVLRITYLEMFRRLFQTHGIDASLTFLQRARYSPRSLIRLPRICTSMVSASAITSSVSAPTYRPRLAYVLVELFTSVDE